jgi:hypothetical protein
MMVASLGLATDGEFSAATPAGQLMMKNDAAFRAHNPWKWNKAAVELESSRS